MDNQITLSKSDDLRLRVLIRSQQSVYFMEQVGLDALQDEMDRAQIVSATDLPDDVVTLDSRVLVRDLDTSECNVYTLVCRARANLSKGELSVAAPLGTALLGCRAGESVEWQTPGGIRRVLIEAVKQPFESPVRPPPRESLAA